jgi:hypothetical protein
MLIKIPVEDAKTTLTTPLQHQPSQQWGGVGKEMTKATYICRGPKKKAVTYFILFLFQKRDKKKSRKFSTAAKENTYLYLLMSPPPPHAPRPPLRPWKFPPRWGGPVGRGPNGFG